MGGVQQQQVILPRSEALRRLAQQAELAFAAQDDTRGMTLLRERNALYDALTRYPLIGEGGSIRVGDVAIPATVVLAEEDAIDVQFDHVFLRRGRVLFVPDPRGEILRFWWRPQLSIWQRRAARFIPGERRHEHFEF